MNLSFPKLGSIYLYTLLVLVIAFLPFHVQDYRNLILSQFNGFENFTFSNLFSTWVPFELGTYSMNFTPQLLYAFALYKIFPAFLANTILFGSIKTLAGFSIYLFLGIFTKNNTQRILGSLFYLLSIYGQAMTLNAPAGGYLFYAILPLVVYFFVKFSTPNKTKYTFFTLLSFILLIDTNATYIVCLFIFLFVYSVVWDVSKRSLNKLFNFIYFLFLFIIASLGYYLPLFSTVVFYKSNIIAANLAAESAGWKSSYSSITEIMRMMGSLDFYTKSTIQTYAKPFFQYFLTNQFIVWLSYLVVIFSLAGIFFEKKVQEGFNKFTHVVLLSIFLFFSFGANMTNPFIALYTYLSNYIPLFSIFRDEYKSVSILNLIYSIGIVKAFLSIETNRLYRWIIACYIGILFFLSIPYFLGSIFSDSEMISIPLYWNTIASWSRQTTVHQKYKLLLPSINFPLYTFTKQRGKSTTFVDNLFDDYVVRPVGGSVYQGEMDDFLSLYSIPQFESLVGFYGISYIINQKDIDYKFQNSESPFTVSRILQQTLLPVKTFGRRDQVEVYQIPDQLLHPIISIPRRVLIVKSDTFTKENLIYIFSQQKDNNFMFVGASTNIPNNITNNSGKQVMIETKKLRNYLYKLVFHNVEGNFPIVFNQRFHNGWIIKGSNPSVSIPLYHFMANGLVNGFIIDPKIIREYNQEALSKQSNGKTTITLYMYFQPQMYFYVGYLVTGVGLIASLSFFLYSQLSKK